MVLKSNTMHNKFISYDAVTYDYSIVRPRQDRSSLCLPHFEIHRSCEGHCADYNLQFNLNSYLYLHICPRVVCLRPKHSYHQEREFDYGQAFFNSLWKIGLLAQVCFHCFEFINNNTCLQLDRYARKKE